MFGDTFFSPHLKKLKKVAFQPLLRGDCKVLQDDFYPVPTKCVFSRRTAKLEQRNQKICHYKQGFEAIFEES